MKRVIAMTLVLMLVFSLSGCVFPSMDELCGTWEMKLRQKTDTAETMLGNMEFYPEEIALIDTESLDFVMIVEFNADKTYRYAVDVESTKVCIREFYADAIAALYEGRESLTDTYGKEILNMTQEEFEQAYAEMFSMESIDVLLDYFVENCVDYGVLAESFKKGTFRLLANSILLTADGSTTEEKMEFKIDGDTLTLIFIDGEEVYTRQK